MRCYRVRESGETALAEKSTIGPVFKHTGVAGLTLITGEGYFLAEEGMDI